MSKFEAARLRAGAWWRERREKAAERKWEAQDPAGVTVPLWLVNATKFASWIATLSLIYFLWLYTLDIARDRAGSMHLTHVGQWVGDIQFWFPYIVGFALVAFGIPYVAKIAIPAFMSLSWRGDLWAKLWALFIAVAVSLVVITGTFTVQGNTIMERDRDAAVAVEEVQQGHAALEAQIESRRQELSDMMNNRNAYLAQAASVGAVEWERTYVAQARATNDPRLPMIERALGAARSADTARAELQALRQQLAASQTVASVQREVVTERTGWIASTLGWLEGARAILLSFVMDIVALMMPWIALRLEQTRNRQMGMADGIPLHRFMIDDKSTEERPGFMSPEEVKQKTAPLDSGYKGPSIYDENGNELQWVEGFVRPKDGKWIPGHYRKTGQRKKRELDVTVAGKNFTVSEVAEDAPGDGGRNHAPGVDVDGADRIGTPRDEQSAAVAVPTVSALGESVGDSTQAISDGDKPEDNSQVNEPSGQQEEPPLSPEEEAAISAELESTVDDSPSQQDQENVEYQEAGAGEGEDDQPAHDERPPETNPARLLVAAE